MSTLYSIAQKNPEVWQELLSELGQHVKITTDDLPARIFSVETCIRAQGVAPEKLLTAKKLIQKKTNGNIQTGKPFMVALLPCGLRNAFKETFYEKFPHFRDNDSLVVIDGNLNFEKLIYNYLDYMNEAEELPDIMITSDINNLYYHNFLRKFLDKGCFDHLCYPANDYFTEKNLDHPGGAMRFLTANLLVMVVNNEKFSDCRKPEDWYELMSKKLKRSLVLRGDQDFFCSAVLYPFYESYGEEALRILGENTRIGMHPAEMVKEINSKRNNDVAVYVMPYSFAQKVRNANFSTVWPNDGAIVSPVQILVKKGCVEKHREILEFIFSETMGEQWEQNGFPALHANTMKRYPGRNLKWVGWDFFLENDLKNIKKNIHDAFMNGYKSI